ncbi:MAG: alpha/beta fold hydrolase, partial [Planctomycetes bacterium]|nr:alpha/beta fold hydrolase [Planctomycetota bacterium]
LYTAVISLLLSSHTSAAPAGSTQTKGDDLEASARSFVQLLAEGNAPAAARRFDGQMKKALPGEKLAEVWKSAQAELGVFEKILGVRTENPGRYSIVFVTCRFARGNRDVKLTYDPHGRITGLYFVLTRSNAAWKVPAYADRTAFRERDVSVGQGELKLPGTLTMPLARGPFPAVVLVHGSGPQDRDESIGPNKPFCDMAWGLASRGIAVLRYDKRNHKYPEQFRTSDSVTVTDETIDDALSAVELLGKTAGIDGQRIFVVGHSFGGTLVPRIAARQANLAGIAILAGSTRALEDVLLEQLRYTFSLDEIISEHEQKILADLEKQAALVKGANLSRFLPQSEWPFAIPPSYWLDLRAYDPGQTAGKLDCPILILQGQRDYQATMEDFQGWKTALSARPKVQFNLYPKLNHLFIAGEGQSTPAEYDLPGNVDQAVVEDIAAWIKGRQPKAPQQ